MEFMKPVIPPVPVEVLEAELTKELFVRKTNKGDNRIYDFAANEAPNLLREVGRLRELTFRAAGGGTGKELDLDEFDTSEVPYRQLIVWNPVEKEILGGYRYIMGDRLAVNRYGELEIEWLKSRDATLSPDRLPLLAWTIVCTRMSRSVMFCSAIARTTSRVIPLGSTHWPATRSAVRLTV